MSHFTPSGEIGYDWNGSQRKIMRSILPLALFLSACSTSLSDPDFSTGSHTIVSDSSSGVVYAVDADNGAVVRQDVSSGKVQSLQIGVEPSRIARSGNTLYVSLRGERAIAVVEDRDGALTLVKKVQTGTEPVGLVMREDGERLYVALSTQGEVQELDEIGRAHV